MKTIATEVRTDTKQKIFRYILEYGPVTRQELFAELGYSLPTIKQTLEYFQSAGLIETSGQVKNTGGRNAASYSIVADCRYAIGLYISHHHMTASCTDYYGNVLSSVRIRMPMDLHRDIYLEEMGKMVDRVLKEADADPQKLLGVGIAVPSLVSEDGETIIFGMNNNYEGVTRTYLSKYIPYKTYLFHDCAAAAFSELWRNPTCRNAIYMNLNTTVGSGIIIDGRLFKGNNNRAGEIGHMIVEPRSKKTCYCGQKGCLDLYCATTVLESLSGGNLDAFFEMLAQGKPEAKERWDKYIHYLARAIHNLRMVFDGAFIIGGYLGTYMEPYMDQLAKAVDQYSVFTRHSREYIIPCKYKKDPTAAGAAIQLLDFFIKEL